MSQCEQPIRVQINREERERTISSTAVMRSGSAQGKPVSVDGKYNVIFYLVPPDRLHRSGSRDALYKDNLLLRGCTVRNTEEAVGIVIYAGEPPPTPTLHVTSDPHS